MGTCIGIRILTILIIYDLFKFIIKKVFNFIKSEVEQHYAAKYSNKDF